LDQVERWLEDCERNHPQCAPGRFRKHTGKEAETGSKSEQQKLLATDFLPKRLLDVGEEPGSTIRLVETESNNIEERYLTLSYRWGETPWFRLEKRNEEELTKETKWSEDFATFTHVVQVARRLKVRYVWIDAMCIIQDNGEFRIEGETMDRVYGNSVLNIAAASSADSTGGLFRTRSTGAIVSTPIEISGSVMFSNGVWRIFPGDIWEHQLLQEILYRRAWVFQERYLSPRLVHFASKQMFWDCAKLSACETFPSGLPQCLDFQAAIERHWRERLQNPSRVQPNRQLVGSADDSPEELWRTAVHSYTSCALTNSDDKLLAIWGVAKLVKDILKEEYAVGMWQNNMHEQLAWRVEDCAGLRRMSKMQAKKVPSWSWASIAAILNSDGAQIVLPDRLGSIERVKVARDHDGKALAFRAQDNGDSQPVLVDIRLAIRAHVFRIHARQEAKEWLFVTDSPSYKRIRFSPDTQAFEDNHRCDDDVDEEYSFHLNNDQSIHSQDDFATIIACSRVVHQAQIGAEEIPEYEGFGLTMEYLEMCYEPTFRRTGMFSFQGLTQREIELMDRTCNFFSGGSVFDTNKDGLKFWLE
jgi:hypothetical protein